MRNILENVKVIEVKEYKNNPRKNDKSVDFVVNSIKEFGYGNPIIVDENMEVIAGHTRLKAIKKLKWDTLPEVVQLTDLTEEQKKAYRIADNSAGQGSEWDNDLLKIELDDINLDMSSFGLIMPEVIEPNEQDDEVPEVPKEPQTVLGDIIELGRHRLYCGDATDFTAVEKLMNGQLADMIFTNPPYNVDYVGKTKDALKIQNDKKEDSQFLQFLIDAFTNLCVSSKKGASIYICHADSEGLNFRQAMKQSGFLLKQCLIWVKNSLVMGRQDYHWQHEPILYGWVDGASHNWYSDRKQTTVWNVDRPTKSVEHPTMKPVELVSKAIFNSSKQGDIVLDIFGGGGSTLISSDKLERNCYTMELEPKYCDVIITRYCDYVKNNVIKVNGIEQEWKATV